MKNVIVGTAGHVDHGKTCLIKALTGMDTDRLKEEKNRGITIENGFADMMLGDFNVSIIDVPGHERFIKNMLAGIGGIDMVLLVIGLDEGVMPQTREHFQILKMLNIKRGIIVFTKRDLVSDEEWIELVKEDARDLTRGSFMENAPSIEVSACDGYNIEELKKLIADSIDDEILKNSSKELFRLPVDRVFTIDGFGTVITGTLIEGSVKQGDEVMIYPAGKPFRVRNVQVHGEQVSEAFAGQRTAINLAGIKKEEIERGSVIAAKGALEPAMMVDVRLELFEDADRAVLNNSRVHFYCGSSEALCKVVLLDRDAAEAGDACYAQLRLEEPIAVKKDDRFIIRFYSPLVTVGGGKVLEAAPSKHKRGDQKVLEALRIKDEGKPEEAAELIIDEKSAGGITASDLASKMRLGAEEAGAIAEGLASRGRIRISKDGFLLHTGYIEHAGERAAEILEAYHSENRISPGMNREEFRSRLMSRLRIENPRILDAVYAELERDGKVRTEGNVTALGGFEIKLSPELEAMKKRLLGIYAEKGYEMPTTEEVLASEKDRVNAGHMLETLSGQGELVRLSYQYFIDAGLFEKALAGLKARVAENGSITLAEFRDMIGTSRKYAMEILEYLDREKITRKVGDARVLV